MTIASQLTRLARMDREERRFRAMCMGRTFLGRMRHRVAPPRWRRDRIVALLNPSSAAAVRDARNAAIHGDYLSAHRSLGQHFAARRSVWPIAAHDRSMLSSLIALRYPQSIEGAARRGDALAAGRHDLLGYRDVECGSPPEWQRDPIHGAHAPDTFWANVPYLDPACGDHKVTWELNRHQHWRALGRACWLTGDTRYREVFVAELTSWIASNPPERGINWASMLELGFRALSWTWAVEFFCADAERDSTPWLIDLLLALDWQLALVANNLSHYFSPNTHLTGEALGLYAASRAFPELAPSGRRADLGRKVLVREADRQIRPDGGHAELSPHYHRYSTDFYLLALMVARASNDDAAGPFEAAVRAQAEYLRTIADDRGRLPLIGDDDGGQLFGVCGGPPADASSTLGAAAALLHDVRLAVAPPSEEVYWMLGRAPSTELSTTAETEWPSRLLPSTGYFVSRTGNGDHLVFDAGPHGFLNGGHAHSDALSIVLTVAGEHVLIDPGTATYTMDPAARDRFRSTRMHNTVVIDGRDHVTPRGPFHWQGQPNGRMLSAKTTTEWDFAQATHDAYGSATHVRSVIALHRLGWIVVDQFGGDGSLTAEAAWHLHPAWQPSVQGSGVVLESHGRQLALAFTASEIATLQDGPFAEFAPEDGRIAKAPTIRVRQSGAAPFAMGTLIPAFDAALQPAHIGVMPLNAPPATGWVGAAFEVTVARAVLTVLVASPHAEATAPSPGMWGTSTVETDARALVLHHQGQRTDVLAIVDGGRVRVASQVASAVHENAHSRVATTVAVD